ncbi:hypothetical protein XENTR_v10003117 [Xenopus tropicalis]|nr:hypothetical protein XENTR_v10003117 [Xenopus tropicalis]
MAAPAQRRNVLGKNKGEITLRVQSVRWRETLGSAESPHKNPLGLRIASSKVPCAPKASTRKHCISPGSLKPTDRLLTDRIKGK